MHSKSGTKSRALAGIVIALMMAFCGNLIAKNTFDWRMVILPSLGFKNQETILEAHRFLARMKNAGYNGMFLDNSRMRRLYELGGTSYETEVKKFLATAKQNAITIIPMSQGQGGNLHFMEIDRTEGFPCKETPFVVNSGVALAKGDESVAFANGDFENGKTGWKFGAGTWSVDHAVRKSGSASMRCDDPKVNYVRMHQHLPVKPYRTYELSMWVKTQNIKSVNIKYGDRGCRDIGYTVQSPSGNYIYQDRYFRNGMTANSNWKMVKTSFHSLDRSTAKVEVQASHGTPYTGKVWFDDVKITEVGLYTAVIRPGLDVVVRSSTGKVYAAGKDYVVGKQKLTIPSGSAITNGQELLVDWYKKANVVSSEAGAAMCYNDVWDGVRKEIQLEDKWFGTPRAKLMKYSEWRLAGWDPTCIGLYGINQVGSGRYMSTVANNTLALYREVNGSREGIVFNDAYDPFHNSRNPYYVINGGAVGSGYGLSEDIIILNWCGDKGPTGTKRMSSMKFFAGTEGVDRKGWGVKTSKQRQIISCNPASTMDWITKMGKLEQEGKLVKGDVVGIAYHTYKTFPEWYQKIEEMASTCKKAGRWGTGPIPFPAVTPGVPFNGVGVKQSHAASSASGLSLTSMRGTASPAMLLRFTVPQNGSIRLSVHNLQGQKIAMVVSEQMASGTYERSIDVSKMAPGVYFATLKVSGKSVQNITRKMMVF